MNRRNFFQWLSGSLAALCAALVAIPGVRFLLGTVRPPSQAQARRHRVAELNGLPTGKPVYVPVIGTRRDAWTTFPEEPIGYVWLIRRDDATVPPVNCRVDAYSALCPHLRCRIQTDSSQSQFVCPCHRGAFDLNGQPLSEERLGHRNPAPGPLETYPCRVAADDRGRWWVEVEFHS